jgi:fatty acid desaturase
MDNTANIKWYRTPLQKDTLKMLTERSDLKGFLHVIPLLLITAILGVITYFSFINLPLWIGIPIFYLYATVFSFFGPTSAVHELSHRTVFKTKFWNEFFIILFSFLSWTDYVYFRTSHTRHHQYTVHKNLDLEVVLPIKISRIDWIFFLTINVYKAAYEIYPMFLRALGIVKGEWVERIFPRENVNERRKLFWWCRIVFLGHIALAAVFILTGKWILLLLITFTIFFGHWLEFLVGFPQHAGLQPDKDDFRYCCRTIKLNPIFSFLYFQMNYHIEHHMYGGVPFHNLKKLHNLIEYDLPETKTLIPAWKEILAALRKQREDPAYFYVPKFPKKMIGRT